MLPSRYRLLDPGHHVRQDLLETGGDSVAEVRVAFSVDGTRANRRGSGRGQPDVAVPMTVTSLFHLGSTGAKLPSTLQTTNRGQTQRPGHFGVYTHYDGWSPIR
jgi:hypothetical protein